jgi:hypothetical protein
MPSFPSPKVKAGKELKEIRPSSFGPEITDFHLKCCILEENPKNNKEVLAHQ